MSDFLLIVPAGWTQLDWSYLTNNLPSMEKSGVENAINSNQYADMEPELKAGGFIPQESTIVEAKLIDDTFFLVRLG